MVTGAFGGISQSNGRYYNASKLPESRWTLTASQIKYCVCLATNVIRLVLVVFVIGLWRLSGAGGHPFLYDFWFAQVCRSVIIFAMVLRFWPVLPGVVSNPDVTCTV